MLQSKDKKLLQRPWVALILVTRASDAAGYAADFGRGAAAAVQRRLWRHGAGGDQIGLLGRVELMWALRIELFCKSHVAAAQVAPCACGLVHAGDETVLQALRTCDSVLVVRF